MSVLLALVVFQEAPDLQRALAEALKSSDDFEVRERLGRVTARMREGARRVLFGDPEDPNARVLRLYSIDTLIRTPQDARVRGLEPPLLRRSHPEPLECREGPLGEELLVDWLKERFPSGTWEGNRTIEKTPGGQLLISGPPLLQRQVAQVLEQIAQETVRQARVSILVLALPSPRDPDLESLSDEGVERLRSRARLASFELKAHAEQLVGAASAEEKTIVVDHDKNFPITTPLSSGTFVELRALPAAGSWRVDARMTWRKLLGLDEVTTSKGAVQVPRMAESSLDEVRRVPEGRWTLLGRMGPLPEEAKVGPWLAVLVKVSPP